MIINKLNLHSLIFKFGWPKVVAGIILVILLLTGFAFATYKIIQPGNKKIDLSKLSNQKANEENTESLLPAVNDAQKSTTTDNSKSTKQESSPSTKNLTNSSTDQHGSPTSDNNNHSTDSSSSNTPASNSSSTDNSSSSQSDPCSNDVGNGNTIISGPSGPSGGDNDRPFRSLTVHPNDPNNLVVGTERNGLLKTTDGGQNWSRLRKGVRTTENIGYPEVWDLVFANSNPSVLYAATLDSAGPVSGSYPSSMAGIYKSTEGGSSWVRINCGISNSRITSVNVNSSDANYAIVGIEGGAASFTGAPDSYYNGGIFYTIDGGSNWKSATLPADSSTNGFWHLKRRGSTFITFGMNFNDLSKNLGFLKSTDNGKNWSAFGSVLKNLLIGEFDVSTDGQTIYAAPRDAQQIRKSTDGGSNWTTISSAANRPIAVSPSDANLVVFASCCGVYRSIDGLQTETKIFNLDKVSDIVFAPSDNSFVWLIADGYLLYKSTDSGASFSLVKNLRSEVLNVIP